MMKRLNFVLGLEMSFSITTQFRKDLPKVNMVKDEKALARAYTIEIKIYLTTKVFRFDAVK